ncbi:2'-5' RNA ligase family protein [Plantactinospora sp. WMMB782]|uniref:2'-5' RNA ligase family protein n=1 Tax=Plantactinospora sp. WMMB782 TaxID=3404121 RepID=UPI003B929BCC
MRLFVAIYPPPEAVDDIVAQVHRLRIGAAARSGVNVRLTAPSTLHVTVAFLGEVPDERLPVVEEALSRAVGMWHRPPTRRRRGTARRPGPETSGGPLTGRPGPETSGGPLTGRPGPETSGGRLTGRPGPETSGGRLAGRAGPETSGGRRAPRLRFGGGGRFGRGRFTVLWVGLRGEVDVLRRLGATVRRELRRARIPFDVRPLRPHLTLARPGERLDPESLDEDLGTLDGYLGPSWPATELVLVSSQLGPRPVYDRLASWPL